MSKGPDFWEEFLKECREHNKQRGIDRRDRFTTHEGELVVIKPGEQEDETAGG